MDNPEIGCFLLYIVYERRLKLSILQIIRFATLMFFHTLRMFK